jgi:ABC-2 type transport system ATP-binding protein
MSPPALTVRHMTKRFGALTAVDDLSLEVANGELFGVLGPNGAGKTTSIRIINGVLAPTQGKVRVMGMDPITQGCEIRRHTGVLTETPSIYERLTARENLRIFGALNEVPKGSLDGKVRQMLEQFDLSNRADEAVGGFSKGMK